VKRALKLVVIAITAVAMSALSGAAWYALTAPPVHQLALPQDLVDAGSAEGTQMLARSSAKTDYDQLLPEFVPQSRRAFCGVATSVAVINTILHPQPRVTQETLFTPAASAVRGDLAVSLRGLTLEELARIIQAHGLQVQFKHASNSSLESFRNIVRATLAEPLVFLIVNYDRASLGQEGGGHISPIGAYDIQTDRVLVLDVAAHRYPYTWVETGKLWSAMNTTDADAGQTRGYVLVRSQRHGE
jgi:hypothetical protein